MRQGPGAAAESSPAIQFKGTGLYITDYAQKGKSGEQSGDRRRRRRATARVEAEPRARATRRARQQRRRASRDEERRAGVHAGKPTVEPTSTSSSDRAVSAGSRRLFRSSDLEVAAGTAPPSPAASARSTPAPSEIPACCRCRAARRRSRTRRSAASSAAGAGRSSAESRRAIAGRRFERREDVGRQDVAADDREVRRRVLAPRLLDQVVMRCTPGPRSADSSIATMP